MTRRSGAWYPAYTNAEVTAGRARSVSAVVNAALARRAEADREADAAVRAAAQAVRSDAAASAKVARMTAHVLAQRERHLAQDPGE
ncbi:hypothetical protein AB0C14_16725 [Microbispora hainanensis]|uniref:hypothetical protein n=1 Tax=Microbispora hainanensis TaxID=568844 RepID=UPI0033C9664E